MDPWFFLLHLRGKARIKSRALFVGTTEDGSFGAVRIAIFILLLLMSFCVRAQAPGLRINELQASNSTFTAPNSSATPDWIELFNPGRHTVDLQGMRLVMAGVQHRFQHALRIAPGALVVLWCGGRPKHGPEHVGFTLPKQGGSVVLVAADGITLIDAFSWKDLPNGVSMARMPDGAVSWGYAENPSPGASNPPQAQRTDRLPAPLISIEEAAAGQQQLIAAVPQGSELRYTLDGTPVSSTTGQLYSGPIDLLPGNALRYKCFSAKALCSAEDLYTLPRHAHTVPLVSIAMDPAALYSDSSGINTAGHFANNTRSGMAWEREALVRGEEGEAFRAGLRISGSGSRSLAKRSFKLYLRDRYDSPAQGFVFPDGSAFKEVMLRADASAHAFLRNRTLEIVVQRYGLALDVRASEPTALYLNGRFWGLYRSMPPKDAAWAKAISGAEAVDLLAGPGHVALSGKKEHFEHARETLLRLAPMDSLEALIDLNSLVDLACVELWTGRVDHDINVRCYRPREAVGRWRWILYDMDLWGPADMNSVNALCASGGPEAPYLPQLLAHPALQERLLARMTTLQATAFAPTATLALVDSIHGAHAEELRRDHDRWALELSNPDPAEVLAQMHRFIRARPEYQMRHLAEHCGRKLQHAVIDVPPTSMGQVLLNGSPLPAGKQEVLCFSGIDMHLEATPAEGYEFAGWKGLGAKGSTISLDLSQHSRIKVLFRSLNVN